jgi:hypothetical protein
LSPILLGLEGFEKIMRQKLKSGTFAWKELRNYNFILENKTARSFEYYNMKENLRRGSTIDQQNEKQQRAIKREIK